MAGRAGAANLMRLFPDGWRDYALLDSGDGYRLEQIGPYRLARPDARATWRPALPRSAWDAAEATFRLTGNAGAWQFRRPLPEKWPITTPEGIGFYAAPTPYRHVGFFPEQAAHWAWFGGLIRAAGRPVRVLNLFAYTGLATLAAAHAGATVTHLDAAKKAIIWGRENAELAGLADRPIRWIVDDALKFTAREARRGVRYDGLILDPPPIGHGPDGETWTFERSLDELIGLCGAVLSEAPLFVAITAYTAKTSPAALRTALANMPGLPAGALSAGELALRDSAGRELPTAFYARWQP